MSILLWMKKVARFFGVDIRAYHPSRSESARLAKLLKHHDVDLVLDVGANRGQYATYLRYLGYTGTIVCFEPLPEPYAQLQKLAERDHRLLCAPRMAIGDVDGKITVNIAANDESSSILSSLNHDENSLHKAIGAEKVVINRLDAVATAFVAASSRPFLKIDVQGYERKVLAGAVRLLPQFVGLQIELSFTPLYKGENSYREIIDFLEKEGFQLYDMNPCYSDPMTGRTYQADAVFFRV